MPLTEGSSDDSATMQETSGRFKAPPVCVHSELQNEAMSTDELSKLCFSFGGLPNRLNVIIPEISEATLVSSSSSTSSKESMGLSDSESRTPLRLERDTSEVLNAKVIIRTTSRQGRSSQRWITDEQSQVVTRLVTGCVPILEGGNILFVSASRKLDWILPKGGWEMDESMEESAIRECYEEAGVLGIIGPRLTEVEYETRKAKKRRLELEDSIKTSMGQDVGQDVTEAAETPSAVLEVEQPFSCALDEGETFNDRVASPVLESVREEPSDGMWREALGKSKRASDETCSVASDASTSYTHVRMSLFPLYVTEIKSNWPESGRLRKFVPIDEAIEMMESRPELQAALLEVKAKGLDKPSMSSSLATESNVSDCAEPKSSGSAL